MGWWIRTSKEFCTVLFWAGVWCFAFGFFWMGIATAFLAGAMVWDIFRSL